MSEDVEILKLTIDEVKMLIEILDAEIPRLQEIISGFHNRPLIMLRAEWDLEHVKKLSNILMKLYLGYHEK